MDEKDLEQLKKIVLGPKKTQTEAGSVEERSVEELEDGLKMLQKAERTNNGPQLKRLGIYGRYNL